MTEFPIDASSESNSAQETNQKNRVNDENGAWVESLNKQPMHQHVKEHRADGYSSNYIPKVPDTRVPPEALIQSEWDENSSTNENKRWQHLSKKQQIFMRNNTIKPEPKGKIVGHYNKRQLDAHNDQEALAVNDVNHRSNEDNVTLAKSN